MAREVCMVIDGRDAICYADASTSPLALPDSRDRWQAIWQLRDQVATIAHSHPYGPEAFSDEDLSTMAAIDSALGRSLRYCVVTPETTICKLGDAPASRLIPEPWWAALMRLASGMTDHPQRERP